MFKFSIQWSCSMLKTTLNRLFRCNRIQKQWMVYFNREKLCIHASLPLNALRYLTIAGHLLIYLHVSNKTCWYWKAFNILWQTTFLSWKIEAATSFFISWKWMSIQPSFKTSVIVWHGLIAMWYNYLEEEKRTLC